MHCRIWIGVRIHHRLWSQACPGCCSALTRMLNSGRYGKPYDRRAIRRLGRSWYNHSSNRWEVPDASDEP